MAVKPDGTRMSFWIANALLRERKRAGFSMEDIAIPLDVDPRTIRRLERGESMGRDIDQFVAGYAFLLGMDDGRNLWERALRDWRRHGAPPVFRSEDGPAAAFGNAIRTEALRRTRARPQPSGKRRANP